MLASEPSVTEEKFDEIEGLFSILDKPWKLVAQGSRFGLNGAKFFIKVLVTFLVMNVLIVFYSLYEIIVNFEYNKLLYLILIIIIAIGFISYAMKKAYQYVTSEVLKLLYKNLSVLFKSFCSILVEEIGKSIKKNPNRSKIDFSKTLNITSMINDNFEQTPKLLKKGLILLIGRVPFLSIVTEHFEIFMQGDSEQMNIKMYGKADSFINEFLTKNLNTSWYFQTITLNFLILFLLIYLSTG